LAQIPDTKLELLCKAIDHSINTPLTSGAGRLFDAVSAIIGLCCYASFEAEGPMRLENICKNGIRESYPYVAGKPISFHKTIEAITDDLSRGTDPGVISAKFHNTVISSIFETVFRAGRETGLNTVVISGGTFQNRYLLEHTESLLSDAGFRVFANSRVPSNDGGISLGQLAIAARLREEGRTGRSPSVKGI
jgi:hydrogenase maturation protein HypF